MSRPLRVEFEGALYHVTSRGNARQAIYLSDADHGAFLTLLSRVIDRTGWILHAYCLMPNHFHLLLETPCANLSDGMRQLNGSYTQLFNRRHNRVGHLFQGRYKALLVEKASYLMELIRYVVLNPVRAGLVKAPWEWKWSSYRATAGRTPAPPWLHTKWILDCFKTSAASAREAYEAFVAAGLEQDFVLKENVVQQIYLGSEHFVDEMQKKVDAAQGLSEVPVEQRKPPAMSLERYAQQFPCRREAMARAYMSGYFSQSEIARHFGVHYSTVSRAVRAFAQKNEKSKWKNEGTESQEEQERRK